MTESDNNPIIDEGEAAWAHNRWPSVGLITGWGIGGLLWLLFHWVWWIGFLAIFGAGFAGCLFGLLCASLAYRNK